jgi:hypothetical protein
MINQQQSTIMEFEKAREILNKDKDEEVSEILKLLTILADVTVKNILRESREKTLNYNSINNSALLC